MIIAMLDGVRVVRCCLLILVIIVSNIDGVDYETKHTKQCLLIDCEIEF